MDNETKKLFAKIHNHALLRDGSVPEIGKIASYLSIDSSGNVIPIKIISFDWYENGKKDFFIFNEQGLMSNAIHPETSEELRKEYIKALAKSPKEAGFTEDMFIPF